MPYGLFDFEDTIEPMGLSPVAPQWDMSNTKQGLANQGIGFNSSGFNPSNPMGYSTTNPAPSGSFDPLGFSKKPAPTPQNTGMVTRAFPENPPAQSGIPATAQKFAYMGAENSPPQMMTQAIPENPPSQSLPPSTVTRAVGEDQIFPNPVTDACIPSEGCNPNPVTARIPENAPVTKMAYGENGATPSPITLAMIGNEAPPINTLRMPENPVTPTPPSGQCPAGYQSSNQSSNQPLSNINSNPYGLTAGQQIVGASTGKPFNVNQAGNVWTQIASAR